MKKLFWAMCLTCSPILLNAQAILHGVIVDSATNQPISGVSIRNDKFGGVVSDEKGDFTFRAPKSGDYAIVISNIGYRTQVLDLNLTSGSTPTQDHIHVQVEFIFAAHRNQRHKGWR